MCESGHKMCNAKNWLAIRFTWQNEPYLYPLSPTIKNILSYLTIVFEEIVIV